MSVKLHGRFSRRTVLSDKRGLYIHYCNKTRIRPPRNSRIIQGISVSVVDVRSTRGGIKVFTDIKKWELWRV